MASKNRPADRHPLWVIIFWLVSAICFGERCVRHWVEGDITMGVMGAIFTVGYLVAFARYGHRWRGDRLAQRHATRLSSPTLEMQAAQWSRDREA